MTEVEVTTKRVTTVDSIQEAFGFIMDNLDEVGDQPLITIEPFRDLAEGIRNAIEDPESDMLGPVKFEVGITYVTVEERVVR